AAGEYHWMAGNFIKYGGPKNAGDLPVDAHELIALCAPRLTFISYGVPEKGDAQWLDHQCSYMAAVAAQPVWTLLGARGLGERRAYPAAPRSRPAAGRCDSRASRLIHVPPAVSRPAAPPPRPYSCPEQPAAGQRLL